MSGTRKRGRARGGRDGAEPRARVRLRELQVMELTLEGRTQHEIARELGISQPAVCKILQRIEDRLLADVAWKVERHRARQTLRLEFIYGEAVRAWKASKQETLRKRQRQTGAVGAGTTMAEITSENRHGDPRLLDEARRALQDLRTLWGIDAPERISIDATTHLASMSDEAVESELIQQLAILRGINPLVSRALALPCHASEVVDATK